MQNKLPRLFDKHKICIICEGNEEYEYLDRLKALKVWDAQYEIISDNAGGNGNIPARYQDSYQNGSYELVLVFCDTEKKPYEQYEDIKRRIRLLEVVISEGLWNYSKAVIRSGLIELMMCWRDETENDSKSPINRTVDRMVDMLDIGSKIEDNVRENMPSEIQIEQEVHREICRRGR